MLKKGKTGNRDGQKHRKTEVFPCKTRKTALKDDQNWKTENPNAPSIYSPNYSEGNNQSAPSDQVNKNFLDKLSDIYFWA